MGYISFYRDATDVENIWEAGCNCYEGLLTSIQVCEGKEECQFSYNPFWYKPSCYNLLGINPDTSEIQVNAEFKGYLNIPCISKPFHIPCLV
jgi:hypothetical protein